MHVLVTLASESENEFWHRLSAAGFDAAFSDEDALYDDLLNDTEPR